MAYALEFTADAGASWRSLDVVVQEAALDELERIAGGAALPRRRWVHDVVVTIGGVRHYLFFELRAWATTNTLKVYRVGHFSRPT
jgi:hypothetical protein